jgi:putative addiction module component (TIGR02574 family)
MLSVSQEQKPIDAEIEEAWTREAVRRLEEIKSGREKGVPAKEVMKQARKIIQRNEQAQT